MSANSKKPKRRKFSLLRVLTSIFQIILLFALLAVALISFGTKIPFLAKNGMNFFAVTSGSMEPAIPVGSLIYSGAYRLEDLKEDDIVTYQLAGQDGGEPTVVTHRIVKVDRTEEKEVVGEGEDQEEKITVNYQFQTKGDANTEEDQYILGPSNIIGLYQGHVPQLGYASAFAQTPKGFVLMVIAPATLLIVWEIASLIGHFRSSSREEIEKLKAELAEKKKD